MMRLVLLFAALLLSVHYGSSMPASPEYARLCDSVFCRLLSKSHEEITALKSSVDDGNVVSQFGQKADQICNSALEEFSMEAPLPDDDKDNEELYDRKIEELEKMIDAPLHVLYLRQLALLRERAMRLFAKAANSAEGNEFEAMTQAEDVFRRDASEFTRQNPEWSYAKEATLLKSALQDLASRTKKLNDEKVAAAKSQERILLAMNTYQQQLQAMQQQLTSGGSPWSLAAAYRIPDTNINMQVAYQQGRANVQVSCVPDEAISLLGSNGFVNGVTPGNIGLSFNVNI
eukprot:gene16982-12151_t